MRKPTIAWLIAVLTAFILGFLLAWWLLHQHAFTKPACPQPDRPASTAAEEGGGGAMQGGAAPGEGAPATPPGGGEGTVDLPPSSGSLESSGAPPPPGAGGDKGNVQGSLGGGSGSAGSTTASGPPGGNNDGGDIDVGGGKGKLAADGDESAPASAASVAAGPGSGTLPDSRGTLPLVPGDQDSATDDSNHEGTPVVAADYRYDKSGLPHYPNALKVASGTDAATAAAAAGPNTKNFSVTEIVTDDEPEVVAAWYHDHVPPGWNELQMPSALALGQAIQQTKTPAANSNAVDAMLNAMIVGPQLEADKAGVNAARAAGLTIFQPQDQQADHRMIIVIKDSKTGKTG
ncbi:MAG: hypothetical protein ABI128_02115, partial [Rhodanobacter sp.]